MDRLTSVQWLRMKADGFYNVYEQERFTEAADEIEQLREAHEKIIAMANKPNKRIRDAVVISQAALQQKETE